MPLSPVELAYQGIQSTFASPVILAMANGTIALPITAPPLDPLNELLPMDEVVREIMSFGEQHLEDWHHHVSISDSDMIPLQNLSLDIPEIISPPYTIIQTLDV